MTNLSLKKTTFKNDEMRSHECSYFLFLIWNTVNQMFFLLVIDDTLTKRREQTIYEWTDLEFNLGAQVTWADQWLIFIFQWKLNKQRYNFERMRDKDIEFIHIISIVFVVYSNCINLKILISHWRHRTSTFKLPQASYIVSLNNIRIHERFSSSYLSQPASIRLCTLCFMVIQCSMECARTPPW